MATAISKDLAPFTYTGNWDIVEYEQGKYCVRLLTTGTVIPKRAFTADLCIVDGGSDGRYSTGGAGGPVSNFYNVAISEIITAIIGGGSSKPSSFGSRVTSGPGAPGGAGASAGGNGGIGTNGTPAFQGSPVYFGSPRYGASGGGGGGGLNASVHTPGRGGKGGADGGGDGADGTDAIGGSAGKPGAANMGAGGGGGGGSNSQFAGSSTGAGGQGGTGIILLRGSLNQPPTNPNGITHGTPQAGQALTLSTGGSTDPESNAISYVWERRVDTAAYTQIGITTETLFADTVPTTGVYYQVRVKAVDALGAESGYTVGSPIAINYNNPPVITMETTELGELAGAFEVKFSVDDPNPGDKLTVSVACDDVEFMRAENVTRNATQTASFTAELWARAANGAHVIRVTVDDGTVAVDAILQWSKTVMGIDIVMNEPIATDEMPRRILVKPDVTLALGATQQYFACNNGFDAPEEIIWEDVTTAAINGKAFTFQNATKTADVWGVCVRAVLKREPGTSITLRRIDGVIL